MPNNTCVVCGRRITFPFTLCRHCEEIYGKRVADHPEWVRYLVRERWKWRKRNKLIRKREISFVDYTSDIEFPVPTFQ